MSLSNILNIGLFLLNKRMVIFLRQKKKKYSYHNKYIKDFDLQPIQLLEAVVFPSTSSQIQFDRKIL